MLRLPVFALLPFVAFAVELSVKALLTGMSAGMEREPFRVVRAASYDYVDEHFYWDHPGGVNTAWRLPSKSRRR